VSDRALARVSRLAFLAVVLLLTLFLLVRVGQAVTRWDGVDLDLYRRAAREWVEHGNPYRYEGSLGVDSYRYGAWFAALWIPFINAPREIVEVVWSAVLLACTAGIMVSLILEHGERGLPIALFAGGLLVSATAGGNLQPLLVGALYLGMHRPTGPLWVGLAASVKLVPILYLIPWIGRRQWGRAIVAVLIMAVGLAPTALFEVPAIVTDPGTETYPSLVLWLALAGAAFVVALLVTRTRYAWTAAGTAAVLALPRLLSVDLALLLPAAGGRRSSS
jgi:hypothetical protein